MTIDEIHAALDASTIDCAVTDEILKLIKEPEKKPEYIVLDDVYFNHEIKLEIGSDIVDYNKEFDMIIITPDQLIDLLKNVISHERYDCAELEEGKCPFYAS